MLASKLSEKVRWEAPTCLNVFFIIFQVFHVVCQIRPYVGPALLQSSGTCRMGGGSGRVWALSQDAAFQIGPALPSPKVVSGEVLVSSKSGSVPKACLPNWTSRLLKGNL